MSRFGKGALLMILSALGFSAMQIAIAKTAQGIPLFEQLFFRNLFACIAAFVSLRRKNLAAFGKRENRGLLVFRSAAGYAGMIALFYASGHAAQGDVAIINKMSPFVVTVLACLFLKEKFTAYQGVALGLAFGGALLVSNPTFQSHWFPVAVAFLSAVFSGVAYTAIGALKNREPPEVIVFFFSLFSTIASGIAMLPPVQSSRCPGAGMADLHRCVRLCGADRPHPGLRPCPGGAGEYLQLFRHSVFHDPGQSVPGTGPRAIFRSGRCAGIFGRYCDPDRAKKCRAQKQKKRKHYIIKLKSGGKSPENPVKPTLYNIKCTIFINTYCHLYRNC